MRHSNISLTMGTYTVARLLDTSEAIEPLPMMRTKPEAANGGTSDTETANGPAADSSHETQQTMVESADRFGCT
jgi:hypothetical protein